MEPLFKLSFLQNYCPSLSTILWWFLIPFDKVPAPQQHWKSLPNLCPVYFPILIFLHSCHPLTCVLCFTPTELLISQINHNHFTHEPLFPSLECFHLPPGKLLFIPQGPAQMLNTLCKAFQISLGGLWLSTLFFSVYIFALVFLYCFIVICFSFSLVRILRWFGKTTFFVDIRYFLT